MRKTLRYLLICCTVSNITYASDDDTDDSNLSYSTTVIGRENGRGSNIVDLESVPRVQISSSFLPICLGGSSKKYIEESDIFRIVNNFTHQLREEQDELSTTKETLQKEKQRADKVEEEAKRLRLVVSALEQQLAESQKALAEKEASVAKQEHVDR